MGSHGLTGAIAMAVIWCGIQRAACSCTALEGFSPIQCANCAPGLFSPPPSVDTLGLLEGNKEFPWSTPYGVAVADDGATAFVSDAGAHTIVTVDMATRQARVVAGRSGSAGYMDGIGTNAFFYSPYSITSVPRTTTVLVVEYVYHRIRTVNVVTGVVTTVAGSTSSGDTDGYGTGARFSYARDVAVTSDGSRALVADWGNNKIRSVDLATRQVSTLAGRGSYYSGYADGTGTYARFSQPCSITITPDDTRALVVDGNSCIRMIHLPTRGRCLSLSLTLCTAKDP